MTEDNPRTPSRRPLAAGPEIMRNTLISAAHQLISIVVGILLLPFMIGTMGTERYGFLLIVQVFSLSGVLAYADIGLQNSFTRHMAASYARNDAGEFRGFFVTTLATFFAIGAACAVVIFLWASVSLVEFFRIPSPFEQETRAALYVYAGMFLIQFPALGLKAFYTAVQDLPMLKVWELASRLIYAGAVVILLMSYQDVLRVVLVEQAVALCTILFFAFVAARRHPAWFAIRPALASWSHLRKVVPYGGHVFANSFTTYGVYQRVPDIVVARVLGPEALAAYAIISRVPRVIKTLTAAANTAAAPVAAALDGIDAREKLRDLVLRGTRYSYILLTPIVVFVLVFASNILRVWVGEEFVPLADQLRGMVVWQYLMFLVFYTNSTLTRTEQFRRLLPYTVGGNLVFLVVLFATVNQLALWSVVASLLASLLVVATGTIVVQRSSHAFSYRDVYHVVFRMPVVGNGILAFGLCLILWTLVRPDNPAALAAAAALFYTGHIAMLYRLGLQPLERKQVTRLLRRALGG